MLKENVYEKQSDKDKVIDDIIKYFVKEEKKSFNLLQRKLKSKEEFKVEVENYLNLKKDVPKSEIPSIIEELDKYLFGYSVLEDLINEESISDIKVINENNIRIKQNGRRKTSNVKFRSRDAYTKFVDYVAIKNKTNISDINAIQTFSDKESNEKFRLRINISTEFVNDNDLPYLHIRKIPKKKYTIEKLISLGMLDRKTADYLIQRVKGGYGFLFCGKGGAGKTYLMNALLEHIPHEKSVSVYQENEELFTDSHPEMMFQHVVTSRGEGKIEYTLKDLAKNGLLTDNDYFIIGEVKGEEAKYLLNAAYSGHIPWASVHAISSEEGLAKVADYVKYASDYTQESILKMIRTLSTVVFLKDFKVAEISEVARWNQDKKELEYNKVL